MSNQGHNGVLRALFKGLNLLLRVWGGVPAARAACWRPGSEKCAVITLSRYFSDVYRSVRTWPWAPGLAQIALWSEEGGEAAGWEVYRKLGPGQDPVLGARGGLAS